MNYQKNRFQGVNWQQQPDNSTALQSLVINSIEKAGGTWEKDEQTSKGNFIVNVNGKKALIAVNKDLASSEALKQTANKAGQKYFNATDAPGLESWINQNLK